MKTTKEILLSAKLSKPLLAKATASQIDRALICIADRIILHTDDILEQNQKDIENAIGKISEVMLDRLRLTKERIEAMANGIRHVAELPSPLGKVLEETTRPNGINIKKVSVSIGVVAMIYESRPNVTSDAAALALKSGNVAVLRAGKEAFNSAFAIVSAIREGLSEAGLPENAVNIIEDTSRNSANELMTANGYVDLLIPRGGAGLIRACVENATVPCIQTGTGICHVYVDKYADTTMALNIIENAKTSRPSVCNAEEVCLVHKDVAADFLPKLHQRLVDSRADGGKTPVELRCNEGAYEIIGSCENVKKAEKSDFDTEFLDYILAVSVVDSIDEAIEHIRSHSTEHSDAIVTERTESAEKFKNEVDSAAVYVNVSTRFTDGEEFGFGCEIGISTQKLHARGPMGLRELTTYKYIIEGNGQIR